MAESSRIIEEATIDGRRVRITEATINGRRFRVTTTSTLSRVHRIGYRLETPSTTEEPVAPLSPLDSSMDIDPWVRNRNPIDVLIVSRVPRRSANWDPMGLYPDEDDMEDDMEDDIEDDIEELYVAPQEIETFLNNLSIIPTESIPEEEASCNICLERFAPSNEAAVRLNCDHVLGRNCIQRWLSENKTTCPFCRANIYQGTPLERRLERRLRTNEEDQANIQEAIGRIQETFANRLNDEGYRQYEQERREAERSLPEAEGFISGLLTHSITGGGRREELEQLRANLELNLEAVRVLRARMRLELRDRADSS